MRFRWQCLDAGRDAIDALGPTESIALGNKIGFTMSMLLAMTGILLWSGGLLLQSVLPKLGRMAFNIAKSDSDDST